MEIRRLDRSDTYMLGRTKSEGQRLATGEPSCKNLPHQLDQILNQPEIEGVDRGGELVVVALPSSPTVSLVALVILSMFCWDSFPLHFKSHTTNLNFSTLA